MSYFLVLYSSLVYLRLVDSLLLITSYPDDGTELSTTMPYLIYLWLGLGVLILVDQLILL